MENKSVENVLVRIEYTDGKEEYWIIGQEEKL